MPTKEECMIARIIVACLLLTTLAACGGASVSPDDVFAKFKAAGLEAENATPMDAKMYGLAPLLCQDGARRFIIPSLGTTAEGDGQGGRLFICKDEADATKLKTYYDKIAEASALFHSWTYQKGGVMVQINGDLDQAKAEQYGKVIAALP
jgi:hypothetical protein